MLKRQKKRDDAKEGKKEMIISVFCAYPQSGWVYTNPFKKKETSKQLGERFVFTNYFLNNIKNNKKKNLNIKKYHHHFKNLNKNKNQKIDANKRTSATLSELSLGTKISNQFFYHKK
jgi:hypothetical protein